MAQETVVPPNENPPPTDPPTIDPPHTPRKRADDPAMKITETGGDGADDSVAETGTPNEKTPRRVRFSLDGLERVMPNPDKVPKTYLNRLSAGARRGSLLAATLAVSYTLDENDAAGDVGDIDDLVARAESLVA